MRINPNALVFFALSSLIGYFVDGNNGALVGLTIALALSLLASFL